MRPTRRYKRTAHVDPECSVYIIGARVCCNVVPARSKVERKGGGEKGSEWAD